MEIFNHITETEQEKGKGLHLPPKDTVCQHTVRGRPPVKILVATRDEDHNVGVKAALDITGTRGTVFMCHKDYHDTVAENIPGITAIKHNFHGLSCEYLNIKISELSLV